MLRPSEIFTEQEKELARDIYYLASQTYLDILNPFAKVDVTRSRIIRWKDKLEKLLNLLED